MCALKSRFVLKRSSNDNCSIISCAYPLLILRSQPKTLLALQCRRKHTRISLSFKICPAQTELRLHHTLLREKSGRATTENFETQSFPFGLLNRSFVSTRTYTYIKAVRAADASMHVCAPTVACVKARKCNTHTHT